MFGRSIEPPVLGAEAEPSGLAEINRALNRALELTPRAQPLPRVPRVQGMIELILRWMSRNGAR
jgi:hypothetical protein